MEKLFSLKDEESELYAQIKISKEIWKFLNDLTHKLFNKSWMIDDHYQSLWNKTNINDYFHFKENGVDLPEITNWKWKRNI